MKTNLNKNSNKARKRRKKTQKRVAEYRHQTKLLNNKLSFEGVLDKPITQDKPSIKRLPISIHERLRKLVKISPEAYSELAVLLDDHTFIIENGLIFNSRSEFVCSVPSERLKQFNKARRLKQA